MCCCCFVIVNVMMEHFSLCVCVCVCLAGGGLALRLLPFGHSVSLYSLPGALFCLLHGEKLNTLFSH